MGRVWGPVSIRFEVRGGFRPVVVIVAAEHVAFQSALRFAVVSDSFISYGAVGLLAFQSALRFAVVSDATARQPTLAPSFVSIRFEVRGGFRQDPRHRCRGAKARVSIRFEVRGGFRPQ